MLNRTNNLLTLSNNIILCFSSDIWTFSLKEQEENGQVKNEISFQQKLFFPPLHCHSVKSAIYLLAQREQHRKIP